MRDTIDVLLVLTTQQGAELARKTVAVPPVGTLEEVAAAARQLVPQDALQMAELFGIDASLLKDEAYFIMAGIHRDVAALLNMPSGRFNA